MRRTETTRKTLPPPVAPPVQSDSGAVVLALMIGGPKGRSLAVKLKDSMIVGSGGAHWELDLDLFPFDGEALGVSRRHLVLSTDGNIICAEDLHSECGTRINGVLMQPERAVRLRSGDELALGDLLITVRVVRVRGQD